MDSLFAPWRFAYLVQAKTENGCVFCSVAGGEAGADDLVVHRGRHNFVILNLYPYNNGHLMIVPRAHVASPSASTPEQRSEMTELAVVVEEILRDIYHPDGLNLGMNLGRAAGAGIAHHYHLHVVPRWSGDTNFMTVTAGTRVIPEDLTTTRDRIRRSFAQRLGPDADPPPLPSAGAEGSGG
jgi:ATP adenylyltransferase